MTIKHLVLFQFKADIGSEAVSEVRLLPILSLPSSSFFR